MENLTSNQALMQPVVQFVSYDEANDVGGVSSWLRRTVPTLREQGIDARIDFLCFGGQPGANAAWCQKNGVPFRWSPWLYETEPAVRQCLSWLRDALPQVYVPNCILPAYIAAAEARLGAEAAGVTDVGRQRKQKIAKRASLRALRAEKPALAPVPAEVPTKA